MQPKDTRIRIVIAGAGFAGAYAAQALRHLVRQRNADILVIDRQNYFIFFPLLVEAGTGSLEPRHAVVPLRHFLGREVRFRLGEVVAVDPERRQVRYRITGDDEDTIAPFDHLLITTGSQTVQPPIPGLKDFALGMKSLGDSLLLRDRMVTMLELANTVSDEAERARLLHLVVIGGGFTGVETAGEFNEYLREATASFRNLKPNDIRVTLVDGGDRLLTAMPPHLSEYTERELRRRGVSVLLKRKAQAIEADRVLLDDGTVLQSSTVLWAAGVKPPDGLARFGLPLSPRGFIATRSDLRVEGYDNIWAAGDVATVPDADGKPYGPTAQVAMRMGPHVAGNIERALEGLPPLPFRYRNAGSLAAIGYRRAVADLFGITLTGFPAWFLWRTVYLLKMPTLPRKLRVAWDWTAELLFSRDVVQFGMPRSQPPQPATKSRPGGVRLADEASKERTLESVP